MCSWKRNGFEIWWQQQKHQQQGWQHWQNNDIIMFFVWMWVENAILWYLCELRMIFCGIYVSWECCFEINIALNWYDDYHLATNSFLFIVFTYITSRHLKNSYDTTNMLNSLFKKYKRHFRFTIIIFNKFFF